MNQKNRDTTNSPATQSNSAISGNCNDPEKGRWISFRVTLDEYKTIKGNSERADDMGISEYCRARALNLKLWSRLTRHEVELLENLDGCRSDIYHFGNALNGMSRENKIKMFNNREEMLKWLKALIVMGEEIKKFLERVRKPNRSRTSKPEENDGKEVKK